MVASALDIYRSQLEQIRADGLFKEERVLSTPQGVEIEANDRSVLNFCANNYLGLASHEAVIKAAHRALDRYGFGLASVRFICGTQTPHKQLEQSIARFFGCDDAILYSSCFDANGGLFETVLGPEDAVISDALNHASIIDGVRLCKAKRLRYANSDMQQLEAALRETESCRVRLIATDGVFSMDGYLAKLDQICALAKRYDALVMVDDSHATGFVGKTGRGSAEAHGVMSQVDIFTSTLGKALGGGAGGFTTGRQAIIDLLRQRSRPYLFSNTLTPAVVGASIKVFEILASSTELRDRLQHNTEYFRQGIEALGFDVLPGNHPIIPIMLYDAKLAQRMAAALLQAGIYCVGFFYPVVPQGQARIRLQISAAHTRRHLDQALQAFAQVGKALQVI